MQSYKGLELWYVLPAVLLSAVIAAGPVVALLGTTLLARLIFAVVLAGLTVFFYALRSWRKQAGLAMVAIAIEFVFLVIIFFKPEYPLRGVVLDAIGTDLAGLAWQVTIGASMLLLILGSAILLWGFHAHRKNVEN